jgi:ribosomal protein S18 acetylase RimI-like enzyme
MNFRTMAPTIRRMNEADAQAVAQLSTELGYPSEPEAVRRRFRLVDPADFLVVAVDDADVPLGFIHGRMTRTVEADSRVHIIGLVVSLQARRSGVGRRLVGEVERWAATTDAEMVVVKSNTARGEAHEFYPAVGYERLKTQAVYVKRLR